MDIKNARQIYNDIWEYHKKYIGIQDDEKFIKSMISDKEKLIEKYSGNTFAAEMIFVVFKSLIESWKEKYAQQEQTQQKG